MSKSKSTKTMQIICALFLAMSLTLERHSTFSGSVWDLYPHNFPQAFELIDILLFLAIALGTYLILEFIWRFAAKHLSRNHKPTGETEETLLNHLKAHKLLTLLALLVPFLCWLLVLFNYYPGSSMNDQISIIEYPLARSDNHPVIYNLSLSAFVNVGDILFNNANLGVALFVIAQMMLCCAILAFCALWLSYNGCSQIVLVVFILFFSLCPVISNYAFSTLKDTLFAYWLILWIPFLYEAAKKPQMFWTKRSSFFCLTILITGTILIRNNGLYICLVLAIALIILYKKVNLKGIIIASLAGIMIGCVPNLGLASLGKQQLFSESLGVPLQQINAVAHIEPESLSDTQWEYLDSLMPKQEYQLRYAPMNVDELKFSENFNILFPQETKAEFFQTYLEIGTTHPDLYTRAYCAETYGYWSLFAPYDHTQSFLYSLSDNVKFEDTIQIMEERGLQNKSFYPSDFANTFDAIYRGLMVFPSGGMCFFLVLLIGFGISIFRPGAKWLLVIFPCVLAWGTIMVSAPVSSALRYVFPLIVALPVLLGLLLSIGFKRTS